MFLGPQHFQQNDRHVFNTIAAVNSASNPYPFGIKSIQFDEHALTMGRFSVLECSGIFPDGTPFSLPQDGPLPDPLDVSMDDIENIIFIGIPFESHAEKDVAEKRSQESFSRYLLDDQQIRDRHSPDSDSTETVFTANLWARLQFSGTGETAFHTIPISRISNVAEDRVVTLDPNFFPCAMAIGASIGLQQLCRDLDVQLAQRGKDLSEKVGRPDGADSAQLSQFFILQIINRAKPLVQHVLNTPTLTPESLYRELAQLAGELATFCTPEKRAPELPAYNHRDQFLTFDPLMNRLRENLDFTIDQKVASHPVVSHSKPGIYSCRIPDLTLFRNARFILAASARVPSEDLRRQFLQQTTLSSTDKLRDLVTTHTTGISLSPVVQLPNNIPMYDQHLYFELDTSTAMWSEIGVSGIIAMHIAGNFPDLTMQMWTISQ
ncbi:type VI secretion system-associated protein [Chromatiales bacterium (ex Bugula neritina AB1)]|nr:type VI secretion system-associated protein [Chromatiales bacterium (ex Bugula neritina AB1)]